MAADELIMGQRRSMALRLSKMQDQKLLTLILDGGSDIFTSILAHIGSRCIDYGSMAMHRVLSAHDARPKIVDAPLKLIFWGW